MALGMIFQECGYSEKMSPFRSTADHQRLLLFDELTSPMGVSVLDQL